MIQPVNALSPKVSFKGAELRNPINRKTERRLAIMNAGGLSLVTGAVTTAIGRSFTSSWKNASLIGGAAGILTMLFVCPRLMYRAGIKSYAKEQYQKFQSVINAIDHNGLLIHCCNTSAVVCYDDFSYNMARVGVGIYGLQPDLTQNTAKPNLKQAITLRGRITNIHTAQKVVDAARVRICDGAPEE